MRIKLSCRSGSLAGKTFEFDAPSVAIGRNPSNQVAFDPQKDPIVSGQHCEVFEKDGALFVRDLGSRHGTLLDGQEVKDPAKLRDGAVLKLGKKGPELAVSLPPATPKTVDGAGIRLTCLSGSLAGKTFEFGAQTIALGRGDTNQIRLDPFKDPLVSGQHCEVFEKSGQYYLRDLKSKHGTLLNGRKIDAEAALPPGSVIRLGNNGPEFAVGRPGDEVMPRTLDNFEPAPAAAAPPAAPPQSLTTVKGKPKRRVWAWATLGLTAALVILGAVSFWLYLNSLFAEGRINSALQKSFGPDAGAKSALIHWPTSLEILNLRIPDSAGRPEPAVSINSVELRWDPWELLTQKRIGQLTLHEPRINLLRDPNGAWNFKLPAGGASSGVKFDQARVSVNRGELTFDLGASPLSIKQLACALTLPDAPTSPVRFNSFSASIDASSGKLAGEISSRNILVGPITTGRYPFEGSLNLTGFRWDSGRGWNLELPQQRLVFEGAAADGPGQGQRQITLQRLELEDVFNLKDVQALWDDATSRLDLTKARLQVDLGALRKALSLPGLDVLEGRPEIALKDLQLAFPGVAGAEYTITGSVKRPEGQKTVGAQITPAGLHIADIEDLDASVELTPGAVKVPQAAVKLNFGPNSSGTVSFSSRADLKNKTTPIWLQMFSSLENLSIDVPLRGLMESAYIRQRLPANLLLDGQLRIANAQVQPRPSGYVLNGLKLTELEVLRWPVDAFLFERPDGKFNADFDADAEVANGQLSALNVRSKVSSGGELSAGADIGVDLNENRIRITKAYVKTPLARLVQVLPFLKLVGLNGRGELSLRDATGEVAGNQVRNLAGMLDLRGVEVYFSLGEKSPIPAGLFGFRNINGTNEISVAPENGRERLFVKGKLAAAADKRLEFFSPNLGIKAEPIEGAQFQLACDLAPRNGRREINLELKWQSAGKDGNFSVAGVFTESAQNKHIYELEVKVATSLLQNFNAYFRGFFDTDKKTFVSAALKIDKVRLQDWLEPVRAAGLLPAALPEWLKDASLKKVSVQLDESEGGGARLFDPNIPLSWKVSGEVELGNEPGNAQPALRFDLKTRQLRTQAAWVLDEANFEVLTRAAFAVGPLQFRFPQERGSTARFRGALRATAGAQPKVEIAEASEANLPGIEILLPGQTQWLEVPRVRLNAASASCDAAAGGESRWRASGLGGSVRDWLTFKLAAAELQWPAGALLPAAGSLTLEALKIQNCAAIQQFAAQLARPLQPFFKSLEALDSCKLGGSLEFTPIADAGVARKTIAWQPGGFSVNGELLWRECKISAPDKSAQWRELVDAPSLKASVALQCAADEKTRVLKTHLDASFSSAPGMSLAGTAIAWQLDGLVPVAAKIAADFAVTTTSDGASRLTLTGNEPLQLSLPALSISQAAPNGGTPLASPAMQWRASRGTLNVPPGGGSGTWRLENVSAHGFGAGDGKLRGAPWCEVDAESAAFAIAPGSQTINSAQVSNLRMKVGNLQWLGQHLLKPNLKHWRPALSAIELAGSLQLTEARGQWAPQQWALTTLVKMDGINVALNGGPTLQLDDLSGTLPVALHQGAWPAAWQFNQEGQCSFQSVRVGPAGARGFALSLPKTTLNCAARPGEIRLGKSLQLNVAGGELRLDGLILRNILESERKIEFDAALTADLNQCASALGLDLAAAGLELATHRPQLNVELPRCRISGPATSDDPPWLLSFGESSGDGKANGARLSIRGKDGSNAFEIGNIAVDALHVPGIAGNSDCWQAGALKLKEIKFGDFGILFKKLGLIDLQLYATLQNFKMSGASREQLLSSMQPFTFALGTPFAREKPYWFISLTDQMKNDMSTAFDLGGFERWIISKQMKYEFYELGIEIRLKDGLLVCNPLIKSAKNDKRYFIRGIGMLDPDIDTAKIPAYLLVLPWQGLQNAVLTQPVKLEEFLNRIQLNPKIEELKKTGVLGENAEGKLQLPPDAAAAASAAAPSENDLKTENNLREAIYQWACREYFKPGPGDDPERFYDKCLAWVRAKAGRLNRDRIVGNKKYALCWIQHPVRGDWLRAGDLRRQLIELFNQETRAGERPDNDSGAVE